MNEAVKGQVIESDCMSLIFGVDTDFLKRRKEMTSLFISTVFKELLSRTEQEKSGVPHIPKIAEKKSNRHSIQDMPGDIEQTSQERGNKKVKANTVSGGRNKIRKILDKTRFSILPPKLFR